MKIQEIRLSNFRSFASEGTLVGLCDLTTLVGPNSSGKSNLLGALDLFLDYSRSKVVASTFHYEDLSVPIEIAVTFAALDDEELAVFRRHLSPDGSLRITQRVSVTPSTSEESGAEGPETRTSLDTTTEEKRGVQLIAVPEVIEWLSLEHTPTQEQVANWWSGDLTVSGVDLRHYLDSDAVPSPAEFKTAVDRLWEEQRDAIPQIDWLNIQKKPTKTQLKKWWEQELTVSGESLKSYLGDTEAPPPAEEFFEAVGIFWNEHFPTIPVMRHEASGKVLGWANVLKGHLPRLVYLPAIRHLDEELRVAKTNPFGMLLNWLLGDIQERRLATLQDQINDAIDACFEQDSEEECKRIDQVLDTLNSMVREQIDIDIALQFNPPDISTMLTGGVELIGDDGYTSPIGQKGQGVQRSVMFAMLRTYCHHREQLEGIRAHNHLFAIEEPEVCLHPAAKRATYSLLRRLSEGRDQVIYSTHDGYFVDVRHFDEVRVLRRVEQQSGRFATNAASFPIADLVADAAARYGKKITKESIRERLSRHYDPARNEGFFAKKVLLVEGQTEEYSLPVYFAALGCDLDQEEIAVIGAGSVQNLDWLYIVFNELQIPCYVVFDGDKPVEPFDLADVSRGRADDLRDKSQRNKELVRLLGKPEMIDEAEELFFPSTQTNDQFTIFVHRFEIDVHQPHPRYAQMKAEAGSLFGTASKPLIARYIAEQVVAQPEAIPQVLADALGAVKACQCHGSCLLLDPTPA